MKIYIWFSPYLSSSIEICPISLASSFVRRILVTAIPNIPTRYIKDSNLTYNFEYLCIGVSCFSFPLKAVISITRSSRVVINLFLNSWRIQATQHSYKLSRGDRESFNPTKRTHFIPSSASQKTVARWICCQLYVLAAVYNMITD